MSISNVTVYVFILNVVHVLDNLMRGVQNIIFFNITYNYLKMNLKEIKVFAPLINIMWMCKTKQTIKKML